MGTGVSGALGRIEGEIPEKRREERGPEWGAATLSARRLVWRMQAL